MYPLSGKNNFNFKGIVLVVVLLLIALAYYFLFMRGSTPFDEAVKDIKAGRAAKALPVLEEIVRRNPDDATTLPWLAEAYLLCDRIAEGRTALDTAIRLNLSASKLEAVVLSYSDYYQKKRDYKEAAHLFDSLAEQRASKRSDWSSELSAAHAELYINWAQFLAISGDLNGAVACLSEVKEKEPNASTSAQTLINRRLAEYLRQLAVLAELKDKNDTAAINYLSRSLQVFDDTRTRMNLAALYLRHHDYEKAIESYQQAVKSDDNNLEARHRLVEIFVAKKNFEKARDTLLELVNRELSVENCQLLAALQLKLNNKAGAVRALENATSLRDDDPMLWSKLKEVLIAWSRELQGQGKMQESLSVKGHADRVAEKIAELTKQKPKKDEQPSLAGAPNIALLSSHIYLARGSVTPEGEIQVKNASANQSSDLTLTVVFYDRTARKSLGSVSLPVATGNSPLMPGSERTLYFSCPTTVKTDHQLSVFINWQGRVIKELPVVKQR